MRLRLSRPNGVSFWLSFLVAVSSTLASSSPCTYLDGIHTSMMRRIFNQGFHKELSTEIELMLTTVSLPERCFLLVEETIPKGMYVDPDQLRDISEFTGLRTYVAANVDVEKPEFEAEVFRLFVFRELEPQENLRVTRVDVPVHLRYHKPREPTDLERARHEQPMAIVKMQNPRLLLSCDEEHFATACPERMVSSYCDSSGSTKCEFLNIPYRANTNGVEVSVPVGNLDHTLHVVALTTLVVSGATVYLMVSLFRKSEHEQGQQS